MLCTPRSGWVVFGWALRDSRVVSLVLRVAFALWVWIAWAAAWEIPFVIRRFEDLVCEIVAF